MEECRASRSLWITPVVVIALETGMRLGEIVSLKWSEVDLVTQVARLTDTKIGTGRDVPLSSRAARTLEALPRSLDGRVFPIGVAAVKSSFHAAAKRAELDDFRFHDLRHSAASYLAMNGASLAEIADVLGHKTLQMVKRYAHLSEQHTAGVVARMNERIFGQ